MSFNWTVTTGPLVLGFVYCLYKVLRSGHRDSRLPPGPPTVPILGNLHQIPKKGFYKKVQEWSDQYGGVFSLKLGSGTMIVLNDRKAAHDLVDKRSSIYADRPHDHVLQVSMRGENTALMDASPLWRAERKIASQNLAPRALDEKIGPIQEAEASKLMYDLLNTPEEFFSHVKRTVASVGSIVLYGFRATTIDSPWATGLYTSMLAISETLEVGSYPPVEYFPFLKLIPDRWAPWIQRAKRTYKIMTSVWKEARERVEERRRRGDKRISLADRLLSDELKMDASTTYDQFNNFLGAIMMGAGDTLASATLTNIRLLAVHPDVQRKAQEELDTICGLERMPEWSDFSSLPYVNCIVKEGLRFRPVVPNGVPHRAAKDDWYEGMFIPKGAAILIPAYALNRSTGEEDVEEYKPDRFRNHPKLAMDYAGSPDYMNRDKFLKFL